MENLSFTRAQEQNPSFKNGALDHRNHANLYTCAHYSTKGAHGV